MLKLAHQHWQWLKNLETVKFKSGVVKFKQNHLIHVDMKPIVNASP